LKPAEVILRSGRGKRENKGGDEPNWGMLYAYMKMSQRNLMYDNYILIKTLKMKIKNNAFPLIKWKLLSKKE
jgi:hypothetical protein